MESKNTSSVIRLKQEYEKNIRPALQKELGLKNIMEVPRINKIVVNIGVKEAVTDSKELQKVKKKLAVIAKQAPIETECKKSIAGFKIREGMKIGACVTLRNKKMYEFLDELINIALPRVRDFQGVTKKLDGRGNYNLGVKEWIIFPEAEDNGMEKPHGMNITIHTSAHTDEHGFALLKQFGMPFKKK
jgi:large subunit ribosomal protein L5